MTAQDATSGRYPGGKNCHGMYQWVIDLMPAHAVYVESHLGSGAILRRKAPALRSIALDLDGDVIDDWRRLNWPGLELHTADATAWLAEHAAAMTADWLIYVDPPYPHETRTKKRIYRHEMSGRQHMELLDVLIALPARVMLSTYANAIYARRLTAADWQVRTRTAWTRGRTPRQEQLWTNFDPDQVAPAPRVYAGDNYRERERIKRKAARWRTNFARCPPAEQQAILASLLAAYPRSPTAGRDDDDVGTQLGRPRRS